jgi:prevent-host-death family protein
MDASKARTEFAATLKRVRDGERIVLERHGKPCAAIVSLDDLELIRTLEDLIDIRDARAALRDAEVNGTISLEDLKAELGL